VPPHVAAERLANGELAAADGAAVQFVLEICAVAVHPRLLVAGAVPAQRLERTRPHVLHTNACSGARSPRMSIRTGVGIGICIACSCDTRNNTRAISFSSKANLFIIADHYTNFQLNFFSNFLSTQLIDL
jgi:hypothetical protein